MILPRELADPDQRASLQDRVRAARDLGERDPRIGAEVAIAAGPFVAGSDGTEGDEREQPRREAHTSAFAIDLVPVTVLQMARFLAASPYADRALWSDAGWEWSRRSGVDRPRFWGEAAWAAYFGGNQPVVGVSVHEAEAYARWAGRRLPTELEWERAARGEDGRRYPWGDPWDPLKAHHRGNARHTLPVGCFPAGQSPHGLLDAAGNVWEWCAGLFDAAGSLRPARGGGWNAHPPQLRCAGRNAWSPEARFSHLGFRTAR